METEWDIGYFIRINSRTTEYLVAKGTGIFSTTTIGRHQGDKAYDPEIVKEVTTLHRLCGARRQVYPAGGQTAHCISIDPESSSSADDAEENQTQAGSFCEVRLHCWMPWM